MQEQRSLIFISLFLIICSGVLGSGSYIDSGSHWLIDHFNNPETLLQNYTTIDIYSQCLNSTYRTEANKLATHIKTVSSVMYIQQNHLLTNEVEYTSHLIRTSYNKSW